MEFTVIVEALIFASPEPISTSALVRCIRRQLEEGPNGSSSPVSSDWPKVSASSVDEAVAQLNQHYEEQGRCFRIGAESGGWRLLSHPDFAPWINQLLPEQKPPKLSPAALETLAIIAYRQPITKAGVEAIRGVGVDGVLQTVVDRGLVRTVGRAASPGRPLLYGTSDSFLEHFGINDLDDLPNAEELRAMALPPEESPPEDANAEEQLVFAALPRPGENGGEEPEKLSPVAAARKLAESQGSPPDQLNS